LGKEEEIPTVNRQDSERYIGRHLGRRAAARPIPLLLILVFRHKEKGIDAVESASRDRAGRPRSTATSLIRQTWENSDGSEPQRPGQCALREPKQIHL